MSAKGGQPEKNYVPMFPKGGGGGPKTPQTPPSDGSGKGNVSPAFKDAPKEKGASDKR